MTNNHHLRPNNLFSNIFTSIILFTPDPAEYGTTLSLIFNDQTLLPTTKHQKTLGSTFDPKLKFSQYINFTVIKAKQTLNTLKALTSNKLGNKTN